MDWELVKPFVIGQVRHALTGAAGVLVAHGILQSSNTEAFVAMGLYAAGAGWSWWDKIGRAALQAKLASLKSGQASQPAATIAKGP